MEGRPPGGDPGYDDWFDEPEPSPPPRRRGARRAETERADDVWTMPQTPSRRAGRGAPREPILIGGRPVTTRQLLVGAGSALALLLAILAAAGVFSSGGRQATSPPPTVPTTTASTSTTAVTTPAPPAVQAPTATLKPGDTGTQVKLLQKALTALGYSPGKADGSYGPATKAALAEFQKASGLTADGVFGPLSLAAVKRALAAQSG